MRIQTAKHVSRVRWKWIFGVPFFLFGVYSLIKRWLFWQWDADWKIADLLVEPGLVLLGAWLCKAALTGTLERMKYGSVSAQATPAPVRAGQPCSVSVLIPAGMGAGETINLLLECELVVPDDDGAERTRIWQLRQTSVTQAAPGIASGVVAKALFDMPQSLGDVEAKDGRYETLTLHASSRSGLERELLIAWERGRT
jgi:hypothetical protein